MSNDSSVDDVANGLSNVAVSDAELAQPNPAENTTMVNPSVPTASSNRDTPVSNSGTISTNVSTPLSFQSISPRGEFQKVVNNRRVSQSVFEVVRSDTFKPIYAENLTKAQWAGSIFTALVNVYKVLPGYRGFLGEDRFIDHIIQFRSHDFYTMEDYLAVRAVHRTTGSKEETLAYLASQMGCVNCPPHRKLEFDELLARFDSIFKISASSITGEEFIKVMNAFRNRTPARFEIAVARLYSHCWYYQIMKDMVEREARRHNIILKPTELHKLVLQDYSVVEEAAQMGVLDVVDEVTSFAMSKDDLTRYPVSDIAKKIERMRSYLSDYTLQESLSPGLMSRLSFHILRRFAYALQKDSVSVWYMIPKWNLTETGDSNHLTNSFLTPENVQICLSDLYVEAIEIAQKQSGSDFAKSSSTSATGTTTKSKGNRSAPRSSKSLVELSEEDFQRLKSSFIPAPTFNFIRDKVAQNTKLTARERTLYEKEKTRFDKSVDKILQKEKDKSISQGPTTSTFGNIRYFDKNTVIMPYTELTRFDGANSL